MTVFPLFAFEWYSITINNTLTEITDLLPTVTLYHYLRFYSKLNTFVMFLRVMINTQRLKRISTCINLFRNRISKLSLFLMRLIKLILRNLFLIEIFIRDFYENSVCDTCKFSLWNFVNICTFITIDNYSYLTN